MTRDAALPDMYVLDAVADDVESLDGILSRLNTDAAYGWGRTRGRQIDRAEVVTGLSRLIQKHHIRAYVLENGGARLEALPLGIVPSVTFDEVWFGITPGGLIVHGSWDQGSSSPSA